MAHQKFFWMNLSLEAQREPRVYATGAIVRTNDVQSSKVCAPLKMLVL